MLEGRFLYAIKVHTTSDTFSLCPADVERITAAAGIEIGGIEYIVDDREGQRYYYDVNVLSNFVVDAPRVMGFDPFARLADWLEQQRIETLPVMVPPGITEGATRW